MPSWTNTPSGTMSAMVLTNPTASPPSVCFTFDSAYPKPSLPSKDWALVRVRTAGLNRAELRARGSQPVSKLEFGMFINEFHPDCPKIIGEEFVGEVADADKSSGFEIGERVAGFAYGGGKAYDGSYAEYTICHVSRLYHLGLVANDLDWDVLGAIPMGFWTAYGAIFVGGETEPGDSVFIHGASSSVGIWAIIIAKEKGCIVVASTRQESKVQVLKDAGADYVVLESDLRGSNGIRKFIPKGVNTVLELVGLASLEPISMPALALHGTTVLAGILGNVWSLPEYKPELTPPTCKLTTYATLEEHIPLSQKLILEAVEKVKSGRYKKEIFLDRVFDLKDIGKAHQYMEDNKAVGR